MQVDGVFSGDDVLDGAATGLARRLLLGGGRHGGLCRMIEKLGDGYLVVDGAAVAKCREWPEFREAQRGRSLGVEKSYASRLE